MILNWDKKGVQMLQMIIAFMLGVALGMCVIGVIVIKELGGKE